MKKYRLLNNLTGWLVFAVAAVVYLLTIEPTASLWDCGEFIASAYKLEVGHPPGNPIFMMTANLFTQLTANTALKAAMVNTMSAIFSALTILFLFWTITHLVKKLIADTKAKIPLAKIVTILACGAVGALAYTFSDTFWFSAVEGEVYAFSSLMTALVFWLILKWEDVADEPHADRWLILIAYLMGISIGVHLLNLLCIPAIVLVYYFKKNPAATAKGSLIALLVSFVIVAILLFGIIQGVVKVAGWFELLFVNTFSLPYNSGVVFYVIFVAAVLIWGIWETMREKYEATRINIAFTLAIALLGIPFLGKSPWIGILILIALAIYLFNKKKNINPAALNSILTGLLVITIGYSSYALIMIRSAANPPMDQNSPEDIFTLRTYLSREQYGETPLIYGPTYVSEYEYREKGNMLEAVTKDTGPVWTRVAKTQPDEKDRYFDNKEDMSHQRGVYMKELNMLFPRMYSSSDPHHIEGYKSWANVKGQKVKVKDYSTGGMKTVLKPTFIENIRFFLKYQVNFMYIRYFMWNFSGRQNDIQGNGEIANGNWITGIPFIDRFMVGPQDDMPDFIAKNKGHNVYYMLPLILGLLGIAFQFAKGRKGAEGFWITFLLFFMTGLAIVVYLNQTPYQPRERDYAYAGSFYAFCIWIGIGVAYITKLLEKYLKLTKLPAAIAGGLLCLLVPIQMASQTWDDHDRSRRYTTRDFGYNYLTTCEPNAVIFTMGDNDTFPLWYAQEVEGYRTDVRVCNLSYLQTDWYIDQMKRQAYESAPLPVSWNRSQYIQGKHDVAFIRKRTSTPLDVAAVLNAIKTNDSNKRQGMDYIPTDMLAIPVDKEAVLASGTVKPEYADKIADTMFVNLAGKTRLGKQSMMMLEMLRQNKDWTRPFYMAITVSPDEHINLDPYFRQDGAAYRIVPYETTDSLEIDSDILYENLMHKYRYGNLQAKDLYVDESTARLAKTFRSMFGILGKRLVAEGKNEKAIEAMDHAVASIPSYNVPYDMSTTSQIAETYFLAGDTLKAKAIFDDLKGSMFRELNWYSRLNAEHYGSMVRNVYWNIMYLSRINETFYLHVDMETYQEIDRLLQKYYSQFREFEEKSAGRGGRNG